MRQWHLAAWVLLFSTTGALAQINSDPLQAYEPGQTGYNPSTVGTTGMGSSGLGNPYRFNPYSQDVPRPPVVREINPEIEVKPLEDVPSAAAQGFSKVDTGEDRQAQADEEARNTARQKGERISVPALSQTVAKDRALRPWLHAWTGRLVNAGVHPDKVAFESRRLGDEEFARWGSRQLWAAEKDVAVVRNRACAVRPASADASVSGSIDNASLTPTCAFP